MRDFLKILAVVAVAVVAGAYASRCSTEILRGPDAAPRECVVDTITYVDTIPYYQPEAKAEVRIGEMRTKVLALPQKGDTTKGTNALHLNVTAPRGLDTDSRAADSVEMVIPITQREYEGEDYRAWVSGYEPRLDSIFVFGRRETVTIRKPHCVDNRKQKRWGIGVFAGYGMTPHGFQPCAGISINYNLINF